MFFRKLFGGKKDDEKKDSTPSAGKGQDDLKYPDEDCTFKILLTGDHDSGKSSLLLRYVDGTFTDGYVSRSDGDFKYKTLNVRNDRTVKLQIWDPLVQRFYHIASGYYRGTDGIILCYDTTSDKGFDNVKEGKEDIDRYGPENVLTVIVGTKSDLPPNEDIVAQVSEYADSLGIPHMLCSAKANLGVDDVFEKLLGSIGNFKKLRLEIEKERSNK